MELPVEYIKYTDRLQILVCQIKVWNISDKMDALKPPPENCLTINEVESVEISESFKKLISSATVKFPRGTTIKNSVSAHINEPITPANIEKINKDDKTYVGLTDSGVVVERMANTKLAETADFSVGQRISIKLGYVTDYDKSKNLTDNTKELIKMFDGYITKCSISDPIEIKCENLASGLKKISCPNIPIRRNTTVNDILKDDGKFHLLKGTGLKLHDYTSSCDINIGNIKLTSDLTVADVLTEWSKYKLYSFLKNDSNGIPRIAVGRSYFSSRTKESILSGTTEEVPVIQFDYHVAEDNLTLMSIDKQFLAVEAQAVETNDKFYKVTIRLNPEYDKNEKSGDKSKKWQMLNEVKLSHKLQKMGATTASRTKDRVDLSTYTIIPYMTKKMNLPHNEMVENLLKEAQAYFEAYTMNGIEGTLTVFGDLALRSGTQVELRDFRHINKNGFYIIEEVNTKFGVSGYRQTIKIPYKIKDNKEIKYGTESTK